MNIEKEKKFRSVLAESFSQKKDSFSPVDKLFDILQLKSQSLHSSQNQNLSSLVSEIDIIQHRNEKHLEYLNSRLGGQ